MSESESSRDSLDDEELAADLTARVCRLVGSVVAHSEESATQDFEHFLVRAQDLFARKRSMQGTKSETRDLLAEIMFSRLRRSFRTFLQSNDARDEIKTAEWVLGAVLGGSSLNEFAAALDKAILQMSAPVDYSFAGRADFISIEEVMQLLGSGKHLGSLSLEKADNRIDLYIHRGLVAFLDPHHLSRRVLPRGDSMNYREISEQVMRKAEKRHAQDGVPLLLALQGEGCFRDMDMRSVMRQLGCEVLYDFLREQQHCHFFYRKLDVLPDFALENDLRLGVTPILLEGNRRLDDWRMMVAVFPDTKQPVEPMPDMSVHISSMHLGVIEIKMLALLNGENSPQTLSELMGLPLYDIYQHLVSFAREGAIVAPGGMASLQDVSMSVEESMEIAFEALDANDDDMAMSSALDKVLGGGEDKSGDKVSLDFLKAAHDED